jgi:hypothetical protein
MKIKPSEIKGRRGGAARRCYLKWAATDISHLNVQQFLFGLPVVPAFYRDLRTVRDRARNVRHNDEPPTQTGRVLIVWERAVRFSGRAPDSIQPVDYNKHTNNRRLSVDTQTVQDAADQWKSRHNSPSRTREATKSATEQKWLLRLRADYSRSAGQISPDSHQMRLMQTECDQLQMASTGLGCKYRRSRHF